VPSPQPVTDILTVQSAVLHGMVGNNAAVPVLQSLGWTPLALHTAWYSHHKGHQGWFGELTPPLLFERFLQYAMQTPHLHVTTVLSGYLGSADQAVLLARYVPPKVFYVCDPVMGDLPGGQYVSDGIVRAYRELLVPRATVLIPNQFELGLLSDASVSTTTAAREAAWHLLAQYPALQMVVVKGIPVAGELHLLAVSRQQMVHTQHPIIDYCVHGTGDAFSAAWLALYLYTGDLQTSLTSAGQFVYRAVQRTAEQRQRELQLVPELPWLRQTAMQLSSPHALANQPEGSRP
jgi:pyridoxine kinase